MSENQEALNTLFTSSDVEEVTENEQQVIDTIAQLGVIPSSKLKSEVIWFFRHLGLDDYYFKSITNQDIIHHIVGLYGSKVLAVFNSQENIQLRLQQESATNALYIVPSQPGSEKSLSLVVESRIESIYLKEGYKHEDAQVTFTPAAGCYRVSSYRTNGTIAENSPHHLRIFIVEEPQFPEPNPDEKETSLEKIFDSRFLNEATQNTKDIITTILNKAVNTLAPVVLVEESNKADEIRVVIAYRYNSTHSFFTALTSLYHSHGLQSTRKYIEPTSNGLVVYTIFLKISKSAKTFHDKSISLKQRAKYFAEQVTLAYVLPKTALYNLFTPDKLSLAQISYAYVVWKFAHQFLNTLGGEPALRGADIGAPAIDREVQKNLRTSLRRDAYTESRVLEVITEYLEIIKELYNEFDRRFNLLNEEPRELNEDLDSIIRKTARSELDARILLLIRSFNRNLLKTNFFKQSKLALSFRLKPDFLNVIDYPVKPFAVFFIVGAEFRGFHVRFSDIARGGIRMIRSTNQTAFAANVSSMFDENYNLALTQQKKNKDIPEGGSKGTILLSLEHQDKNWVAFRKYIDALLDLLVIVPGEIVDYYGNDEVLFLGPDEGTADMMDWASQYAKSRNYAFWKSFTTGKSTSLGGIPHDLFGMTTRGVHQFVLGIYKKLNLTESEISKFQTGGPDGDLGSNEIKISSDKTVAIVDGSGVLYDPAGLNRSELIRLAHARKMSDNFNKALLSSKGFFIHINDVDVKLPDGRFIEKGLIFRNNFHLDEILNGVELFVPCGGRPAAVNSGNVQQLWSTELGRPRFRYIVEGANLFFTHEARLKLEEWGVILFKDASANKGGVTSSSLEVLAALSLNDEEFDTHMRAEDPLNPPAFYKSYVEHVQTKIEQNASAEFEAIWREHERSKTPRTILTDLLSEKINNLHEKISLSTLWENEKLRNAVISEHVPPPLLDLVGIDTILTRVPAAYLKAIFGAFLASEFVYSCGLEAGEFGFYEFMVNKVTK